KYFAAGGAEPDTIAGLQLWLDASQLSGVSPGASVGNWSDSSSSGHVATQSNLLNQPTYQPSALNGRPALRFDGSNDYLDLSDSVISGSGARTVVWVARPSVVGNRGLIDLGQGSNPGSAFLVTPEN